MRLVGKAKMLSVHRGRAAIREWLFGSKSRRVVAHATCSVLVVRPK